MLAFIHLFLYLFALPVLLAAPTTVLSSSTAHSSSRHPTSSASSHHTLGVLSTFAPHFTSPSFISRPTPTQTQTWSDPSNHPHHDSSNRNKPIIIFFAVLGGLFAIAGILGLLRCLLSYSRTPKQDRVSDFISRHELEREIAQLDHDSLFLRREQLERPPPPPYLPRPPEYSADDARPRSPPTMDSHPNVTDPSFSPPHPTLPPSPPTTLALPGNTS